MMERTTDGEDVGARGEGEHRDLAGPSRRSVLRCMAWAGAGALWTLEGGVPRSRLIGAAAAATAAPASASFSFVQISDSHIGFSKEPNFDVTATLQAGVDQIKRAAPAAAFILHTGDVSQLSTPAQFDIAEQVIRSAGLDVHYVPGEHDVLIDDGKPYFERFGGGATPGGWYSFDQGGVHFLALVNVLNLKAGGLGALGPDQLAWAAQDLQARAASTPIVVFAHIPLWTVYPEWGWGTDDSAQLLALLKRFGSVTVLNGHIHQILQKVEGDVRFYTARSLAFPQPAPGGAPGPGPLKVPSDQLKALLGTRTIARVPSGGALAVADRTLGA